MLEYSDSPTYDAQLRQMVREAQPPQHPLDHAIIALKAIADLDHATIHADYRHHQNLVIASSHIAASALHLSNLPHKRNPTFPSEYYLPYADALAAAVYRQQNPSQADLQGIPPDDQRRLVEYSQHDLR